MKDNSQTASYIIIADAIGNRYRFFCGQSGMAICTTHPIRAETPEKELRIAWENEGRQHFNKCGKCGRWVCDLMFNVDTSNCVVCSPWEDELNFCPHCGARVPAGDSFCRACSQKLLDEEE